MIITGAPIEHLEFEEVTYWNEIKEIMDWTTHHVTSTLFICWAAQAGLYHFYNVPKYKFLQKCLVYLSIKSLNTKLPLVRGFDDIFMAPHSRHTEIKRTDIDKVRDIEILQNLKKPEFIL